MNEHTAAAVYVRSATATVWTLKAVLYNERRPTLTTDADFLGQNICPGPFGRYAVLISEAPHVRFADTVDDSALRNGAVLLEDAGVGAAPVGRAAYIGILS